jgi:(1->4)-alpha-D-glucan 1-alpha-D-glucosylmutase
LRGDYHPLPAAGEAANHVVALRRGDDVLVAVTRWTVHLEQAGWGDTAVTLPDGAWTNALTGAEVCGTLPAAELFADLPVALLERVDA